MKTCRDEDTDGSVERGVAYLGTSKLYVERKWDGSRTVVEKFGDDIKMIGKSEKKEYQEIFPTIVKELSKIPFDVVLDCELTYLRKNGTDKYFTVLSGENGEARAKGLTPYLMIFDVMHINGMDLCSYTLSQRKEMLVVLMDCIKDAKYIRMVEFQYGDTMDFHKEVFDEIVAAGGEGVVLKRLDGLYVPESRKFQAKVKDWKTTECAVCGITEGNKSRSEYFGALILAQVKDGEFVHVGNTSGFDVATMKGIKSFMDREKSVQNPCGYDKKGALKFVRPKMVVEVKFLGREDSGKLRHPVYLRMRDDKRVDECEFP
jgi:bifunctional non-homologous end joining protein LigD